MWMIFGSAVRNLLLFAHFTASCGRSIVDNGRLQNLYLLRRVWLSSRSVFSLLRLWQIKVHGWIVWTKASSSTYFRRWHWVRTILYQTSLSSSFNLRRIYYQYERVNYAAYWAIMLLRHRKSLSAEVNESISLVHSLTVGLTTDRDWCLHLICFGELHYSLVYSTSYSEDD